jgi:hypothetical protein
MVLLFIERAPYRVARCVEKMPIFAWSTLTVTVVVALFESVMVTAQVPATPPDVTVNDDDELAGETWAMKDVGAGVGVAPEAVGNGKGVGVGVAPVGGGVAALQVPRAALNVPA